MTFEDGPDAYGMPVVAEDAIEGVAHDVDQSSMRVELVQSLGDAPEKWKSRILSARLTEIAIVVVLREETQVPVFTSAQREFFHKKRGFLLRAHGDLRMGIQVLVQRRCTGFHCADDE